NRTELNATTFIADQTPSPKNAYWTTFLNQETPFFIGTGKIATMMKYPVVYVTIKKAKRGFYEIEVKDLVPDPSVHTAEEMIDQFKTELEKDIRSQPANWLWSHRRWKHKKK
ncbi:MAG: lysophospholipid acyltransferase family protein, partial [Bacteroidia bacterium]|nr:lysophospholipid acyltransferase family protein [Bacteroidia bacterium]